MDPIGKKVQRKFGGFLHSPCETNRILFHVPVPIFKCTPVKVFGAKGRNKWLSKSFPVNILDDCLSPMGVARNLNVRLKYLQNSLVRFVTGASKFTHITSSLKSLHGLHIRQRIIFKPLLLVYKYLTSHISPCIYVPWTQNTQILQVPHYCSSIHKSKVHFNSSFSYDAPKLWSDLLHDIRRTPNLSLRLKTYLFQKWFYFITIEHIIASLGVTWNVSNSWRFMTKGLDVVP